MWYINNSERCIVMYMHMAVPVHTVLHNSQSQPPTQGKTLSVGNSPQSDGTPHNLSGGSSSTLSAAVLACGYVAVLPAVCALVEAWCVPPAVWL